MAGPPSSSCGSAWRPARSAATNCARAPWGCGTSTPSRCVDCSVTNVSRSTRASGGPAGRPLGAGARQGAGAAAVRAGQRVRVPPCCHPAPSHDTDGGVADAILVSSSMIVLGEASRYGALLQRLGYQFQQEALCETALTHKSWLNE